MDHFYVHFKDTTLYTVFRMVPRVFSCKTGPRFQTDNDTVLVQACCHILRQFGDTDHVIMLRETMTIPRQREIKNIIVNFRSSPIKMVTRGSIKINHYKFCLSLLYDPTYEYLAFDRGNWKAFFQDLAANGIISRGNIRHNVIPLCKAGINVSRQPSLFSGGTNSSQLKEISLRTRRPVSSKRQHDKPLIFPSLLIMIINKYFRFRAVVTLYQ